jgi:hypothetical protein
MTTNHVVGGSNPPGRAIFSSIPFEMEKNLKKPLLIALGLLLSLSLYAKHFWRGTVISTQEVSRRWGDGPFNLKK